MALTDNLVSYWAFNTNNSSQPDSHGSTSGTVTNAVYTASGKLSGCYDYDGTGDWIDFGDVLDTTWAGDFSVSLWFKADVDNVDSALFGKWWDGTTRCFDITVNGTTKKVDISHSNNAGDTSYTLSSTTSIGTSAWMHVVYTKTAAGTKKLYINGTLEGTANNAQNSVNNTNVRIGARRYSGADTYAFNGKIDEVGVWNVALTQTDVTNLYGISGVGLAYPLIPPIYLKKIIDVELNTLLRII